MDKSDIPKIVHKYISLFDSEEAYNAAFSNFEEVNWSVIKPSVGPEETPDKYRASRRLSNMYRKNNPPSYKFDNIDDFVLGNKQVVEIQDDGTKKIVIKETNIYADGAYIAKHNTNGNIINNFTPDAIRKAFFLEIVWGVFGWEWHDYERVIGIDPETEEPIIEILKGGNLYKIKNIQTVSHIIDGHRLQHINDFLFSQYNVIKVEGFNTSNLVAANRAFKRGTNDDTNYPKRNSSQILECHLVDAYDGDTLLDHYFGYGNTLNKLVEADMLFYNNKIYVGEGTDNTLPINIPNIKNTDKFYSYGVLTDNLKFKMESIEELTDCFKLAIIPRSTVNFNDIFIGNTLNNIKNFSGFLAGASITGYTESGTDKITTVQLDLTGSNVDSDEVIDLSHFADIVGPSEYRGWDGQSIVQNTILNIDLNFSNKVIFDHAFSYIAIDKYYHPDYIDFSVLNSGFEKIHVNFNNKESYITSLKSAFANNTFIENLPVQQVPNNACDDTYIYRSCIFNVPISYNFLNGSIVSPREQGYGQFNDCTINDSYTFSNIQGLDRVEFCGIKFGDNVPAADRAFPYIVQNQNDTTYRYFDMCASKFTSMNTQNIYIDTVRFRTESTKYDIGANSKRGGANTINPFDNCSEVTDLSNVNLYYSNVNDEAEVLVPGNTQFALNFANCTNLIKSPHIHLFYKRISYVYFNLSFRELEYLEDVNLEDLSAVGTGGNISIFDFQDCVALKNLKIGTNTTNGFRCSLDIRGCFALNTSANIDVLKTTLDKLGDNTTLWIMESTWSAVNDNDIQTGYFATKFANMNVSVKRWDDTSYVPGSPRN